MSVPRPGLPPVPGPGPAPRPAPGQPGGPRPGPPAGTPFGPGPAASGDTRQASGDATRGPTPGQGPVRQPDADDTVAALEVSVARLAALAELPVAAHVARYDALHGELSEALAAIDGV